MADFSSFLRCFIATASALALDQVAVQSEVRLPSVFGEHMVLQGASACPFGAGPTPASQ